MQDPAALCYLEKKTKRLRLWLNFGAIFLACAQGIITSMYSTWWLKESRDVVPGVKKIGRSWLGVSMSVCHWSLEHRAHWPYGPVPGFNYRDFWCTGETAYAQVFPRSLFSWTWISEDFICCNMPLTSFPGNSCHELEICNFFVSMYHQDFLEDLWGRIQILSSNGWKLNSGMVKLPSFCAVMVFALLLSECVKFMALSVLYAASSETPPIIWSSACCWKVSWLWLCQLPSTTWSAFNTFCDHLWETETWCRIDVSSKNPEA